MMMDARSAKVRVKGGISVATSGSCQYPTADRTDRVILTSKVLDLALN